jgi:D-aminopeptidase
MLASDLGAPSPLTIPLTMVSNTYISELFEAVVDATEEAILNAMLAAETMLGRDGIVAHRLDPDRLIDIVTRFGRAPT